MKAFVFSVNPQPVRMEAGQYGILDIGACQKGEPYAVLPIGDRVILKDMGDDRHERVVIPGEELAEDLVQRYRPNGVFWSASEKPDKAALQDAAALYSEACRQSVAEADSIWDRTHDRGKISIRSRNAAEHLGLTRKWNDDGSLSNMKRCPYCAESIMADARKCKECNEWLDGRAPSVPPSKPDISLKTADGVSAR